MKYSSIVLSKSRKCTIKKGRGEGGSTYKKDEIKYLYTYTTGNIN